MEEISKIVQNLNEIIEDERNKNWVSDVKAQLDFALNKQNFKLELIDLVEYNEHKMLEARKIKIESVANTSFEIAANYRTLELRCMKCIMLQKEFNIFKTGFQKYNNDTIMFFYTDEAYRSKMVKSIIVSRNLI